MTMGWEPRPLLLAVNPGGSGVDPFDANGAENPRSCRGEVDMEGLGQHRVGLAAAQGQPPGQVRPSGRCDRPSDEVGDLHLVPASATVPGPTNQIADIGRVPDDAPLRDKDLQRAGSPAMTSAA